MKSLLIACFAGLPLLVACAGAAVTDDDTTSSSGADLSVASVTTIEVGRSSGFGPPPPPGGCMDFSRYSVDFSAKELSGNACVGHKPITVSRSLSNDELKRVRTALGHVKQAPRPSACPTDMPVTSLTVHRGSRSTSFVDQRAACGGSTPAVESTLAALLETVDELASTPAQCPPTGVLCTLDCPNTGHINGVPCIHGEFDEQSCHCALVGP